MRITQIHLEGRGDTSAVLSRQPLATTVEALITTSTSSVTHAAAGDDAEARWALAKRVQAALDGFPGAGGDIRGYLRLIDEIAGV
jgi:hypothetical protein